MVHEIERLSRGGVPAGTPLATIKKIALAILFLALISGPLITFTSAFQLPPNLHTPQDGPRVDVAYSHGHGGIGKRGGHDRKMMKRIKGKGSDWAEKMRRRAQGEAFGMIRREGDGHEIIADGKEKRDESVDLAIFAEDLLGLAVNVSTGETTTTIVESTSPLDGFTTTTDPVAQPTPVAESETAGTTTETTSTFSAIAAESSVVTPQAETVVSDSSVVSTSVNLDPSSTVVVPESSVEAVTTTTAIAESQLASSDVPTTTVDASPSASVVTPVQEATTPTTSPTTDAGPTVTTSENAGASGNPVLPEQTTTVVQDQTTVAQDTATVVQQEPSAVVQDSSTVIQQSTTIVQDQAAPSDSATTLMQAEPSTSSLGAVVTSQSSTDVVPTTTAEVASQQSPSDVPVTVETVQSQASEGMTMTQVVPVDSDVQPTSTVVDATDSANSASGVVIQPATTATNAEASQDSVGPSSFVSQTDIAQPTTVPSATVETTINGQVTESTPVATFTEAVPSATLSEGDTKVPIVTSETPSSSAPSVGPVTTTNVETVTQPVETPVTLGTSTGTGEPTTIRPVDSAAPSGQTEIGTPSSASSASFEPVMTSDVGTPTISPSFGPVTTDNAVSTADPSTTDSAITTSQAVSQTDLNTLQPTPTTVEQASSTSDLSAGSTQVVSSSPAVNETGQTTELSVLPSATGTFNEGNSSAPSTALESQTPGSMTQSSTWSHWENSQTQSASASASSSYEPYIPTATTLIFAAPTSTAAMSSSTASVSGTQTTGQSLTVTPETTLVMPSTAVIASNVPTMIVPPSQPTTTTQAASETGSPADSSKTTAGSALISILLNSNNYPWQWVVNNSDATSQLFITFPEMLSTALAIDASQVQTYALQAYSPASYNGESTELLTKWLGYIPAERVNDLAQYIKTPSSPLYSQGGIPGQLALQIDSSYPLVGSTNSGGNGSETSATTESKSDNTRRDTIIGVCVGVGGALWLALAVWIYRRVKRNHDAKIHRRLSERFSVGDTAGFAGGFSGNSRHSRSSSLAASEVDDRPSSFYANDADNFPAARRRRSSVSQAVRESVTFGSSRHAEGQSARAPSGIGSSWFRSSGSQSGRRISRDFGTHNPTASPQMLQNPFADIVHRSYLENGPAPRSGAWRHSTNGRPLDKKLIGAPTLQSNSLEFTGYQ